MSKGLSEEKGELYQSRRTSRFLCQTVSSYNSYTGQKRERVIAGTQPRREKKESRDINHNNGLGRERSIEHSSGEGGEGLSSWGISV